MISLKINNLKNFTSQLLVKDTFSNFYLVEANIHTHSTFTINGRVNTSYYSTEELENQGDHEFNTWDKLRPICYEIIKGRNLPSYFKFIFRLDTEHTNKIISSFPEFKDTDVDGFFINVKYESGSLTITTGTSLKIFTLDKSLEKAFDSYITVFFDKNSIEYSIC